MVMQVGGPETAFDYWLQKWGICNERKAVEGTFKFDNETDALNEAKRLFPDSDPCLMRDHYHSHNHPLSGA